MFVTRIWPGDLLSAELEFWTLNADFVGDIAEDANELVLQFNFPVGGPLGPLVPMIPELRSIPPADHRSDASW
jgi:hypothetical protein